MLHTLTFWVSISVGRLDIQIMRLYIWQTQYKEFVQNALKCFRIHYTNLTTELLYNDPVWYCTYNVHMRIDNVNKTTTTTGS